MEKKFFLNSDIERKNTQDIRPACERKPESQDVAYASAKDYSEHIEKVLETKEYHHWNSNEAQETNRRMILDYDLKKREVDKASLQTQREILTKYRTCFDGDNIKRMSSEIGSNKIEIYNEPYFASHMASDMGPYKTVGLRDFPDGKICVRDNDDILRLKHTATHETMHDLSYQHNEYRVQNVESNENSDRTVSRTDLQSGIHLVAKTETMTNGVTDKVEMTHLNRYLNEGLTELYTVEEMSARGDMPAFDSYTQELNWAALLRDKLGDAVVAEAYFGGDIENLQKCFDSKSDIPGAWREFNQNIDLYHRTGDISYKSAADDIIDSIHDGKKLIRRR